MTRQQITIMWIGLILVMLNWIINWQTVKNVLFGAGAASLLSKTATQAKPLSTTPTTTATATPANVTVT